MHSEAAAERGWDAFAGHDRATLEEYLEAVNLEGGASEAGTLSIG